LQPREEQVRPEDTWIYRLDDDLPGDSLAQVECRTARGKIIEVLDIMDLPVDLEKACPAHHTRLQMWMIADAMDPRTPEVLN
jgi:hypothetical protein